MRQKKSPTLNNIFNSITILPFCSMLRVPLSFPKPLQTINNFRGCSFPWKCYLYLCIVHILNFKCKQEEYIDEKISNKKCIKFQIFALQILAKTLVTFVIPIFRSNKIRISLNFIIIQGKISQKDILVFHWLPQNARN